MEDTQDRGKEKAPPCLVTAAGGPLCFPPHKNPVGTSACWDPACPTEADGLTPLPICWWHGLHSYCFTHGRVRQEVAEVRVSHFAFPSSAEVTQGAVA